MSDHDYSTNVDAQCNHLVSDIEISFAEETVNSKLYSVATNSKLQPLELTVLPEDVTPIPDSSSSLYAISSKFQLVPFDEDASSHDFITVSLNEDGEWTEEKSSTTEPLKVGQSFSTYQVAMETIKKYGEETNQMFVLGSGSAKYRDGHKLQKTIGYSSLKFICKHGGDYMPHRRGTRPTKRPNQKTVKTGCPVYIKLKSINHRLEVIEINDQIHNHQVSKNIYDLYPESRTLTSDEMALVREKLESGLTPLVVAGFVNGRRREMGRRGICTVKNILNFSKKIEKRSSYHVENVETEIERNIETEIDEIVDTTIKLETSDQSPNSNETSQTELLFLTQQFDTHDEAVRAIKRYGEANNQVFVMASGCAKLRQKHLLREVFRYSSMKFICKHGGDYMPHRKGKLPTKRPNQKSTKTKCPVYIELKLVNQKLQVTQICDQEHNHPVNRDQFISYPEVRKLSLDEQLKVSKMLNARVEASVILDTINKERNAAGQQATCNLKTIFNFKQKLKTKSILKDQETLARVLEDQYRKDQQGSYDLIRCDNSLQQMVYIQSGQMKERLTSSIKKCFFSCAQKKLSSRNFFLYGFVGEDERGTCHPLCLAFLSDASDESVWTFLQFFKEMNPDFNTDAIFAEKHVAVLKDVFPSCSLLFGFAHAIKVVKEEIIRLRLFQDESQLIESFKSVMLAATEKEFLENELELYRQSPEKFCEYYKSRWADDHSIWCQAHRTQPDWCTDASEKFFQSISSAINRSGKLRGQPMGLSECFQILVCMIESNENSSKMRDFVKSAKRLKLHNLPYTSDDDAKIVKDES